METLELDIDMDSTLLARTRDLAQRYFGDDSDSSLALLLELAFKMRCLWGRSVRSGQKDTDESVSNWEFPKSTDKPENSSIQTWLFRR